MVHNNEATAHMSRLMYTFLIRWTLRPLLEPVRALCLGRYIFVFEDFLRREPWRAGCQKKHKEY